MQIKDAFFICDMCGKAMFSHKFKTNYEDVNKILPELCLECATNLNKLFEKLCIRDYERSQIIKRNDMINEARRAKLNSKG